MRPTLPLTATVLLAALLAAAASAPGNWLGWASLGGEPGTDVLAEADRTADLHRLFAALRERARNKAEVSRRLLQGELSLFEAAGWFRFLNESGPYPDNSGRAFPGASDEERVCREVVRWAHSYAPDLGPEAERRACQLERELDRHLEQGGRIALPLPEAPSVQRQ